MTEKLNQKIKKQHLFRIRDDRIWRVYITFNLYLKAINIHIFNINYTQEGFLSFIYDNISITMENLHAKFIIVGAGISGLQTANNLAQLDQDFIILEAQNRIGGRIKTVTLEQALKEDNITCNYEWFQKIKHTPVQIGATWICHQHSEIQKLAKKYNIHLHPQYYEGKHILALSEQRKLHLEEYEEYYSQYKDKLMSLIKKMWKIRDRYEQLLQNKKLGKISEEQLEQLRRIYQVYDAMTGYQFIQDQLQDEYLAHLVDNEIQTLQAISSKHFSVLQFLNDDGGWHGIYFYLGIHHHNMDGYRAAQGLSSLLNGMKNNIQSIFNQKGLNKTLQQVLKLSHPVVQIRNHLNPVQVVTSNGVVFTCQKVLMCIPSGVLHKIHFTKISEGKKALFSNMLTSHTIRMNLVFRTPFWRKLERSGNVNFSHEFPMNQLVELTPQDQSCGIVAFVFFKQGYERWLLQIDLQYKKRIQENKPQSLHELTKRKALKIIADLFLEGNLQSQLLQQCVLFTRSLSQSPYIRNTYDSTTAVGTFKKLFELNEDHLDPFDCDQENVVMLGSDFWQVQEHAGYMQGGIRVANSKITKQFVEECEKS